MKTVALFMSVVVLSTSAVAGVVYQIEVTDHQKAPPSSESIETAVEGRLLKVQTSGGATGGNGEMIYNGDRREMVLVDHDTKSYSVIDEKTMKELAEQIGQAMSMIEQALANVPEGQRAQVEAMMKKKMPQLETAQRTKTELKQTGERSELHGYPCVKYVVLRDGRPIRELWVTDWKNVEGGDEVVDLFLEMSEFFQEMLDSLPKLADGGGADQAFEHMREMNGFPVVSRELDDDGSLESESSLLAATRRDLGPDAFEPPSGYKLREMFKGR